MAVETEQFKAKSLNKLSNLRMNREERIDAFVNRAQVLKN